MKFIVSSSALLKQLNGISGVIASNPVVPILENFLFEIEDGILKVTASDLQTSMITEMPVEAKENGSVAIPAKILLDTLKNLPEQPVTFTIDENTYYIELSSDNGRYKLAGENATDFPKIPDVQDGYSVDIPADVLNNAIAHTVIATSSDELKPAMSGVYLTLDDSSTTFVATDGHRLVRYRRVDIASEMGHSLILPKKALSLLKSTLPSESTPVHLYFNPTNAFFSFENIRLICRLIDERFPDYQNVIPAENPNHLTVNRRDLLNSLRRISIYANKTTHQVRFKIAGSTLQIFAEDMDFSNEASETLSCEYNGEDLEIGFNAKFIIEMLNNLSSEQVLIQLSEPNKAGLIFPVDKDENEDLLMLVMPVMLNNYV